MSSIYADIPRDPKVHDRITQTWQLRFMRSATWSDPTRAAFVRFYKRYRLIKDAAYDPDEPNIRLGYVFGLIEQIFSKVAEPILRMRPPCPVVPLRLGDGKAAQNFQAIASAWYSQPNMQEPFCRSKKEMIITGTRVEIDEFVDIQRPGRRWSMEEKTIQAPLVDAAGRPLRGQDGKAVTQPKVIKVPKEIDVSVPVYYGFRTRYPSIFNCYFEPDRPTLGTGEPTDGTWFFEDMGEATIEELAREMCPDPDRPGALIPKYDLGPMMRSYGKRAEQRYENILQGKDPMEDGYSPIVRPQRQWSYQSDYGREDKDTKFPAEGSSERNTMPDRDAVWLSCGRENNDIVTLANGKWVIHRKRNPWHVPVMPVRVECLAQDPEFIYGQGVIQPIEDQLDEMDDVHNLSMSQFIRIINRLMFIAEGRILTMSDFRPRAGGKVRVTGDGSVRDAVYEMPTQSATNEMLVLESNNKGLMEFISANMDGSAGTRGTKQEHKTARGMEIITTQLSGRWTTVQRQALINEARRMQSMERLMSQFGWEKKDYSWVAENGATLYAQFNKDDIFTEGRGFKYGIEIDPTFGDTNTQRALAIDIFSEGLSYEKMRREMGPRAQGMKTLDLPTLFENILKRSGYVDTSTIFKMEDGSMSPDEELQILSAGGVVRCSGDLLHHIEVHILQRQSPALAVAVEAGKAHPDTLKRLDLLLQEDLARAKTFLSDPVSAAQALKVRAGFGGSNAPVEA